MKVTGKNGMSLIVLVITILVLSILAATVIISLSNTNIISEAQNTVNKYNESLKDEQIAYQDSIDMSKVNDKNAYVLEGAGTESNPYLIDSIEDLVLFAYEVNNGKTYEGKYVKLNRNLDFNSNDSYENSNRTNYDVYGYDGNFKEVLTTGEGFIPIGNTMNHTFESNSFYGVFDGNGKTISNLRINKEGKIATDIGLFSANTGNIKNLGIENCNIIINCKEKVNKYLAVGVICGYNFGTIDGSWSSGNMNVTGDAGVTIYCGGISAGAKLSENSRINNCYNKVDIVANVDGSADIGGIVGGITDVSVNNCYNMGNIKVIQNGTQSLAVGGVVGIGNSVISNCYNFGNVEGIQTGSTPHVGGVAGGMTNVVNCCNAGEVVYEGVSAKYVGTLLGLTDGSVTNSYTLTNSILNGIGRNYTGTPEPTKVDTVSEMPTVLEIVGDAFKADTNNINNGYPILNWQ